jgi:hypothetical protein
MAGRAFSRTASQTGRGRRRLDDAGALAADGGLGPLGHRFDLRALESCGRPAKAENRNRGYANPPPPDLATETTSADELPADRWLALARQMADQGDLRLAMRGFYLAILARLADRQLIRIESYKSNLEYKRELNRHAREKTELVVDFTAAIVHFEKIWYGLKSVSRAELDDYAGLYARIAGLADA